MATNSRPTELTLKIVVPWYASLYLGVCKFSILALGQTLGPLGLLDGWEVDTESIAERYVAMCKFRVVK